MAGSPASVYLHEQLLSFESVNDETPNTWDWSDCSHLPLTAAQQGARQSNLLCFHVVLQGHALAAQ